MKASNSNLSVSNSLIAANKATKGGEFYVEGIPSEVGDSSHYIILSLLKDTSIGPTISRSGDVCNFGGGIYAQNVHLRFGSGIKIRNLVCQFGGGMYSHNVTIEPLLPSYFLHIERGFAQVSGGGIFANGYFIGTNIIVIKSEAISGGGFFGNESESAMKIHNFVLEEIKKTF